MQFVTANGTNPYGYNTTEVAANGKPIGPQAASPWLFDVPWGFYKLLKWINARCVCVCLCVEFDSTQYTRL